MKALLDFVPLVVFFFLAKTNTKYIPTKWLEESFNIHLTGTNPIFIATQGLIIASIAVYSLHFILQKWRLEKQQWITLVLTLAFGGLTLYFHDDTWIRWKATAIYWLFGTAFLLSPMVGKPPIPLAKRFLDTVLELSDKTWKKLNLIWAIFFYALGGLQLFVAFTFPLEVWVNFKVFGCSGILIAFMVGQFVILRHHFKNTESVEKQ